MVYVMAADAKSIIDTAFRAGLRLLKDQEMVEERKEKWRITDK
jgi:hypothetical protein